ncbi:unnamed protein product [Rotaria magnacalcarata]|uniref:Uncharacterized protein n=3 Tax=Rotaria magnacalcarata TaxID=392030 RepID=A0A816QV99_9BILA|nr:unnamed protein product [Rotaria magnacalcarata]CAF3861747.1 unnamed protein product [Rotaria magnacalcarata]
MRVTTPITVGACIGIRETLAANRPGASNHDHYPLNQYAGKNFFDGENYRVAIDRLDGGYHAAMDLIEWMQDYCDQEREQARNLCLFTDKWITRLKQQSSLVSYHTTKRAQLDVVRIPKQLAELKESNCDEIQKVIDKYRNRVNDIYINERFRPGRKHRRTSEFKKLFKTAHASLSEVANQLETLRSLHKKAREALRTAESACEILHLDPTATDKQLTRADDVKERKRESLNDIDEKISEMKVKYKSAQKIYRKRATEIFRQCESVEEERLDHIRETLLDFLETMDTSKYSNKVEQIFTDIKDKVTKQQNSFDDRVFWAKSYGIENKLTKSLTLASNGDDAENDSIIIESRANKKKIDHETEKNDRRQSVVERVADDEEASAAINSTIPAKTKVKRTKSITNTDKKTTTEPSTINNTVLNQV